jgi:hypothetical protein
LARAARRRAPEVAGVRRDALLLVAAAALSGVTILRGYGPHDEGLMLAWGARIAHGQWPYRDFWCNYAPGQPLVVAGLWKAFGPSLLAWRVVRLATDAVVSLLAYRLVRRSGGRAWLALLAWLGVAGAMAFPTGPGPNPPALALALGALLVRGEAAGGALAGLAVVFRPEIGIAAALGRPRPRLVVAAAAVAVAGLAPFAIVAAGDMADQVVGFVGIQHLQRLPFPFAPHTLDPNKVLERMFPDVLVACGALWAAWVAVRRRWHPAAPLAVAGLGYLLARTDPFHFVPLSVALAVLLCAAAARERGRAWRAALVAGAVLIGLHGLDRRAGQLLHPPAQAAVPGPAGDGVRTSRADARALRGLLAAVDRMAPPGAPVFVADPRHDLVRFGDSALYAILDRRDPTRYDVMQPGVVTTASVQREIVRELARTRVVVRWLSPAAEQPEPNGAGRSSGVRILDRYLARAFAPRARFGPYQVLVRR